jgi:hypothetical protein
MIFLLAGPLPKVGEDALSVEVHHLLQQHEILHENRAARSGGHGIWLSATALSAAVVMYGHFSDMALSPVDVPFHGGMLAFEAMHENLSNV